MMERKGLETSRYLGGDPMLSILICDDDTTVLTAIRAKTESVLKELDKKAKIHTFTDATSISEQILSGCDIALLDIDFDGAGYNGMDIARKIRSLRSDTIIIFVNGSGKTTLIKLLMRLYHPTEGEILIDGVNIQSINLSQYYANISAIFQDFIKYPFDVYENVAVRVADEEPDRLSTVLDCVGMLEFVNSLPHSEHTLLMRDWTGGTVYPHCFRC